MCVALSFPHAAGGPRPRGSVIYSAGRRSRMRVPDQSLLCPQCLAQVHPDWPFCSHCGTRLNTTVPAGTTVPVCANCGAIADTTGAFCWKCGVPLKTGREPFIPAHPPPPDQEEPGAGSPRIPLAAHPRRGGAPPTVGSFARPSRGRPVVASVLILIAVAFLLASLFVSWYDTSATASTAVFGNHITVTGDASFYLLDQLSISLTCSGTGFCFNSTTHTESYSQGNLTSIGNLYDAASVLVIGSICLGLLGVGLALALPERGTRWSVILIVFALLLAAAAPTLLLVEQPATVKSQGYSETGTGPQNSFWGSCSGSACGGTTSGESGNATWGPSVGWYLGFLSVVPLAVGFLEIRRLRSRPSGASVYERPE